MKSQITYLFLITFLILIVSCQKEEIDRPQPEPDYPTTYKPLTTTEWNVRNDEFQKINVHEGLSINSYGFVNGSVRIHKIDTVTKEIIINNIDSFITHYRNFIGIPKNYKFDYENQIKLSVPYLLGGGDQTTLAHFYRDKERFGEYKSWKEDEKKIKNIYYLPQRTISNKYIDDIELIFNFDLENNILHISGNWISEVLVPQNIVFSEEEAFRIARAEILKRNERDIWESKQNVYSFSKLCKLDIYNTLEIRDCWYFYISEPPYTGSRIRVYVDTQTGGIVKYYSKY